MEGISQKYKNLVFTWIDSDKYVGTEVGILIPETHVFLCFIQVVTLSFVKPFWALHYLSMSISIIMYRAVRTWNLPANDFTLLSTWNRLWRIKFG